MGHILSRPVISAFFLLYPAYATFKSLEKRPGSPPAKRVGSYWLALAILAALDRSTRSMTSSVPGFWVIRIASLSWLARDGFEGAEELYDGFVRPLLVKHEGDLDNGVGSAAAHLHYAREQLHALAALAATELQRRLVEMKRTHVDPMLRDAEES